MQAYIVNILRAGILCLVLIAGNYSGIAQNVCFHTQASTNKMELIDKIQITYTIVNAQGLKSIGPSDKHFQDFELLSGPYQSQSTNVSYKNGYVVQSQSFSVIYILRPKHTGFLIVPEGIAKDASGHCYHSNKLVINVANDSLAGYRSQKQILFEDPYK